MKEIKTSDGFTVQVDDEDYEFLSRFNWRGQFRFGKWYIEAWIPIQKMLLDSGELQVDHADGNTFNNQKSNLRIVTPSQNQQGQKRREDNTTGFKGVGFKSHQRKPFIARIQLPKSKRLYLGSYATAEEAGRAYDRAAIHHFGEYAALNFPRSDYLSTLEMGYESNFDR
jgi:hypothetical protein